MKELYIKNGRGKMKNNEPIGSSCLDQSCPSRVRISMLRRWEGKNENSYASTSSKMMIWVYLRRGHTIHSEYRCKVVAVKYHT